MVFVSYTTYAANKNIPTVVNILCVLDIVDVSADLNANTNLEMNNASKLNNRNIPNLNPSRIPNDSNIMPTNIIDMNTDIAPIMAVLMTSLL